MESKLGEYSIMAKKKTTPKLTEDLDSIANDLTEYMKKPDIGIDTDRLVAFITTIQWKINPNGHTKTIRDKIRNITKKYETDLAKLLKANASRYDQEDLYESATRNILNLGLVGFDYDKSADNPLAGPVALGFLAEELKSFLVEQGSRAGMKHWQMQQKLVSLQTLSGSMDLKTNTESLDSASTK